METKIEKIQDEQVETKIDVVKLQEQMKLISEYHLRVLEEKMGEYKNDVKLLSEEIKILQKDINTLKETEKTRFYDNRKMYALATTLGGTIVSIITYIITIIN